MSKPIARSTTGGHLGKPPIGAQKIYTRSWGKGARGFILCKFHSLNTIKIHKRKKLKKKYLGNVSNRNSFHNNEENFVGIWYENIHTFNAISCMRPNDFWKTFHFHSFFSKGNTGYLTPDTSCTMCKGGTCMPHCGSWVWKRGRVDFEIHNYEL